MEVRTSRAYCGDFVFPQPNTYAEIARTYPSIGGEAARAAILRRQTPGPLASGARGS